MDARWTFDIGIFIEFRGIVYQIPVNPEKFTVSIDGNNATEEIINLGEIVIPKKQKLASISWESGVSLTMYTYSLLILKVVTMVGATATS